jgi:hypothetical protein
MNPMRTLPAGVLLFWLALCPGADAAHAESTPVSPDSPASITLQRSTCLGNCPGYSVSVTPDGQIDFDGHAHVQARSAHRRATPSPYTAILAAVEHAGFRSMHDRYVGRDDGCNAVMTDQPGVKITVVDAAGRKSVDFYYGCTGAVADAVRPRIEQLARMIDQRLDTARWIGTPALPGQANKARR